MNSAIITKPYDNTLLTFREDGWFNMTKAAKAFDKFLPNFMRSPETTKYLEALKRNTVESTVFVQTTTGRNGGTWAHPKPSQGC